MFKAFITLFSEADWLFYVLLVLSVCLLVSELFIPNFSIAGFAGLILGLATVTERCVHGENTSNEILLYMLYIVGLILASVFLVKFITAMVQKKKVKVKYAVVDGNKVPLTKDGKPNYSFLIGEEGEIIVIEVPDKELYKKNINEGDWVYIDVRDVIYKEWFWSNGLDSQRRDTYEVSNMW